MGVTHFALDLDPRHERSDRVDDHHVDCVAPNEHLGDLAANRQEQSQLAQDALQERIWEIVRELGRHNFDSALYSEVEDFQKTIALVPTSVRNSGEGVPELFMLLMGLAQRYLEGRLALKTGVAEGTVLEVKEERGLGKTLGVII